LTALYPLTNITATAETTTSSPVIREATTTIATSVVPDDDPSVRQWNDMLQHFYDLMTAMKDVQAKEIRDEILQFGDVVLEYKNTVPGIKVGHLSMNII
jgi:hypothetical protein